MLLLCSQPARNVEEICLVVSSSAWFKQVKSIVILVSNICRAEQLQKNPNVIFGINTASEDATMAEVLDKDTQWTGTTPSK